MTQSSVTKKIFSSLALVIALVACNNNAPQKSGESTTAILRISLILINK